MKKNTVKLNESQLKKIVAESVKKVIKEAEWKNGVNPDALNKWKAEDRQEKLNAFKEAITALFNLQRLFEVADESGHPLDKAYELIYNFAVQEGLADEL
jgi:hypothetical protein